MTPSTSSTLRARSPHSSCSCTAGRAPGTRSTGPCAAMPDCADGIDETAAAMMSTEAAGPANDTRPSSESRRNATPARARTIVVHDLRMQFSHGGQYGPHP